MVYIWQLGRGQSGGQADLLRAAIYQRLPPQLWTDDHCPDPCHQDALCPPAVQELQVDEADAGDSTEGLGDSGKVQRRSGPSEQGIDQAVSRSQGESGWRLPADGAADAG